MQRTTKTLLTILIGALLYYGCANNNYSIIKGKAADDLTAYVNPLIGTDATGHTFPGATLPFSMVQLSPDTDILEWANCSGYHYQDQSIRGFSHTHLSGTGIGDLGDILLMPTTGAVKTRPGSSQNPDNGYRSRFSHKDEYAEPGYYSVYLKDYKVKAELTVTEHAGFHRYTFPQSDKANVVLDLLHGIDRDWLPEEIIDSKLEVKKDSIITGYRISNSWAKNQAVYFAMRFSKRFLSYGVYIDDTLNPMLSSANGKNIKAVLNFRTAKGEEILIKVGLSAVSIENAIENLDAELPNWNFDEVRKSARQKWQDELKKIKVEGTEKQKEIFYTAMYHAFIHPNQIADVNGMYPGMKDPENKAINNVFYSTFSLWDTFRAVHPLFTLVQQERVPDMINSMLMWYEKNGHLPIWTLWDTETYCMIANHSIPVIVDAYLKGFKGFDAKKAYEAIKTTSTKNHPDSPWHLYNKYGYFPSGRVIESVSKTLEVSFDDWSAAQMAKKLGETQDYEFFTSRSNFYKNVFDPDVGFMRGKLANGNWVTPFNPMSVTHEAYKAGDFTEGNSWQYTWHVLQDVEGLIELMGGKEQFVAKLELFFTQPLDKLGQLPADMTGLIGQYAQGNEQSHHVAYLFNYAGAPWKTQEYVRKITETQYNNTPDGLSGNDDCGQMSAWYVFSAMGFYPVNPASGVYAIGSPVLAQAILDVGNGKTFTIVANNVSATNKYIQSARLNGEEYNESFLYHADIVKGGLIEFKMGPVPNKNWGLAREKR